MVLSFLFVDKDTLLEAFDLDCFTVKRLSRSEMQPRYQYIILFIYSRKLRNNRIYVCLFVCFCFFFFYKRFIDILMDVSHIWHCLSKKN